MPVTIRIFDPAMCCSTGVCGPSVEPELARFAADVDWLQKQGVSVERYNLSQEPAAFASTPAVKEALTRGIEVLPLLLVDDRIAVEGAYPSRETLAALAGVVVKKLDVAPTAAACCTPGGTTKSKTGCC
ncbi:MAG TPA: arsenite efflux transporter metallochaperone ArsD [Polyangiales bacterium]